MIVEIFLVNNKKEGISDNNNIYVDIQYSLMINLSQLVLGSLIIIIISLELPSFWVLKFCYFCIISKDINRISVGKILSLILIKQFVIILSCCTISLKSRRSYNYVIIIFRIRISTAVTISCFRAVIKIVYIIVT